MNPHVRLLAAALCLAATTVPAAAERRYCERPLKPHIPDGAYAEELQMQRAKERVASYIRNMDAYLDCLEAEHGDARGEAKQVFEAWNAAVGAYKGGSGASRPAPDSAGKFPAR